MSFAGSRTRIDFENFYNGWYRQYQVESGHMWIIKIPSEPSIEIQGDTNDMLNFKYNIDRMKEYYSKFRKAARPSSKLKESDPETYKQQYRRYQIMFRTFHDNYSKRNMEVLSSPENLRTAFYEYKDQHYPGSYTFDFYGDDVDLLLEVGQAAYDAITIYRANK